MNSCLQEHFPQFAQAIDAIEAEDFEPPTTEAALQVLEQELCVVLPPSYKRFLRCTRGFTALDGSVQLSGQHPFFHAVRPLSKPGGGLSSEGMLCFAEFALEADGDQVLFDVRHPDARGEYPVYYYAHAQRPPAVRKLADSFEQWLLEFPSYEAFADDE